MKIDIEEKFSLTNISIKKAEGGKNPNLLAFATITFKSETGSYFMMSGFTIWISKFGGLNVEVAKNLNFKYYIFEKSLDQKIKKAIMKEYEFLSIPIIEEKVKEAL
ncbi:MAG: hypothetical protein Q7K38_00315 [Candidatus Wildermuthbacteria bacterium]|nr:hypothetical protein [Candidatus Wildermuthbacteria bacterium]